MKLNKVLCLFLMLAVVFAFASCDVIENTPIGDLIDKLPIGDSKLTVEFNSNGGSKVDSVAVVEGGRTTWNLIGGTYVNEADTSELYCYRLNKIVKLKGTENEHHNTRSKI